MSDEQTKQLFKRAMVAAIPEIGESELDAYTRLASTNYLWPIHFNFGKKNRYHLIYQRSALWVWECLTSNSSSLSNLPPTRPYYDLR